MLNKKKIIKHVCLGEFRKIHLSKNKDVSFWPIPIVSLRHFKGNRGEPISWLKGKIDLYKLEKAGTTSSTIL